MCEELPVLTSDRGFPLMFQGDLDVPQITVENYEKWYHLYIVHKGRQVSKVDPDLITEKCSGLWVDHIYHPKALLILAEFLGAEVPATTLELVAGRWVLEGRTDDDLGGYYLDEDC